jgi:hypothetical protein
MKLTSLVGADASEPAEASSVALRLGGIGNKIERRT